MWKQLLKFNKKEKLEVEKVNKVAEDKKFEFILVKCDDEKNTISQLIEISKVYNCENPKDSTTGCGVCESCLTADKHINPDVLVLNSVVDALKAVEYIKDSIPYKEYKVIIFREAELLRYRDLEVLYNVSKNNAVKIILATTDDTNRLKERLDFVNIPKTSIRES